jgi:hypothetical protein
MARTDLPLWLNGETRDVAAYGARNVSTVTKGTERFIVAWQPAGLSPGLCAKAQAGAVRASPSPPRLRAASAKAPWLASARLQALRGICRGR